MRSAGPRMTSGSSGSNVDQCAPPGQQIRLLETGPFRIRLVVASIFFNPIAV